MTGGVKTFSKTSDDFVCMFYFSLQTREGVCGSEQLDSDQTCHSNPGVRVCALAASTQPERRSDRPGCLLHRSRKSMPPSPHLFSHPASTNCLHSPPPHPLSPHPASTPPVSTPCPHICLHKSLHFVSTPCFHICLCTYLLRLSLHLASSACLYTMFPHLPLHLPPDPVSTFVLTSAYTHCLRTLPPQLSSYLCPHHVSPHHVSMSVLTSVSTPPVFTPCLYTQCPHLSLPLPLQPVSTPS